MAEPRSRPVVVYADHSDMEPFILARVLERMGIDADVVHVSDCEGAVAARLGESPPAMILFRGLMPGRLDGPEAIAEIRRREAEQSLARMPLVIVSSSEVYIARGLDAGADATLGRPWTGADLRDVITVLLPQGSGAVAG